MLNLDDIAPRTVEFSLGGERYEIPTIDALDADTATAFVKKGNLERADVIDLFKDTLDRHAPGAFERMSVVQMRALVQAWQNTGDAGES